MKQTAAFLLAAAVGCSSGVHSTHDAALTAALACQAAKAIVQARKVTPVPVVPDGVCKRCQGRGFIGDAASINVMCDDCKGTGKTCSGKACAVKR